MLGGDVRVHHGHRAGLRGRPLAGRRVPAHPLTQRAQAQALGSTPAAILASASDLKALSADFDLQSAPEQDGLQWVQASPKDRNGQLKSVRVGFARGRAGASHRRTSLCRPGSSVRGQPGTNNGGGRSSGQ